MAIAPFGGPVLNLLVVGTGAPDVPEHNSLVTSFHDHKSRCGMHLTHDLHTDSRRAGHHGGGGLLRRPGAESAGGHGGARPRRQLQARHPALSPVRWDHLPVPGDGEKLSCFFSCLSPPASSPAATAVSSLPVLQATSLHMLR